MDLPVDPLERTHTRAHLEAINERMLFGSGRLIGVPGKLTLVWHDPVYDEERYLSVKSAGEDLLLINGRRYPATEAGLRQGLANCMAEMRLLR